MILIHFVMEQPTFCF